MSHTQRPSRQRSPNAIQNTLLRPVLNVDVEYLRSAKGIINQLQIVCGIISFIIILASCHNYYDPWMQRAVGGFAFGKSEAANPFETRKATYTVIAPAKLRPNSDYHVSVSVHHVDSPVDVDILISGADKSTANDNSVSKKWGPGNYKLTVVGSGGLSFRNETRISFEQKSYSVFIQTDKAIYKPGQTVKFRAVIVNPSLIPTVTGAVDAYILDSKGNRVRQWNRIFSSRGVISQEFQLSNNTLLGDWTIVVDVLDQKFKKSFTIAEYVLPTFDVEVILPSYATYNNSDVVVRVKTAYTYGKPVKGEVTLTVQPRVRYSAVTVRPLEQYQYKSQIDGTLDIPVNVVRDLNLKTDFFEREIEFFALVKESLTGKTYNKTSILKMFSNDIKVELIKTSKTFKRGLKYTILLKVAYQDDVPVEDNGPPLTLKYGYSFSEEKQTNVVEIVPSKGMVSVDVYPPKDEEIYVLGMHAYYRGQLHPLESVEAAQSPSNNFIQVILPERQEAIVGQEITLFVNATENLHRLVYEVMGRGDIVLARTVSVPHTKTYEITFTVTHAMAPKARVIVYYVREENQEIIADAVNFDVEGIFRTPVSIRTSVNQTRPGSLVDVRVKTNPNAFVAVLGLDQSILLLKSGNDITQKDVIDELETYDGGKTNKIPQWYGRRKKRSFWWPGSTSAGEVFEDSGVVIISNGLVYYSFPLHYRMNFMPYDDMVPLSAGPSMLKSGFAVKMPFTAKMTNKADKMSQTNAVQLRKNFPETWLWTTAESGTRKVDLLSAAVAQGRDGFATISSVVPDTITSWIISAFAMDSVYGLGVAPSPSKVTVFRPFFVKMNLPHSIIRGETIAIQVVVFNYFDKEVEAEVVLENNGDFNFTVASNEIDGVSEEGAKRKYITVPAQDGACATFLITTNKIGYIVLEAKAATSKAGDGERRLLLVKAEGQKQHLNKAVLIDLQTRGSQNFKRKIQISIPPNAIAGSEQLSISAIGDVLGPSLNNIDDLLRLPYGCGEQNMLNFVPNIVILDYLTGAKKLTTSLREKALNHMQIGYQQEMTYRRNDGSFSAFGNNDKNGSTWLTAFVLKSFQQAKAYLDIDQKVIDACIHWLLARHKNDGSFSEPGEVSYKAMQGGSSSAPATLTAYVMIALFQNRSIVRDKYTSQIQKTEQYLIRELRNSKSHYATALIAYALHAMDSPSSESAFEKLMTFAKRENDYMWWSGSLEMLEPVDKQSSNFFLPKSTEVEATAYALLTLVHRSDIENAIPVMRWLISQQNSNGGFSSTQDTVIALQALGQLASRISTKTIEIDVKFKFGESNERQRDVRIDSRNAMVLQRYEFPSSKKIPPYIEIEASGFGTAVAQVSWSYNLAVTGEEPSFFLNPLLGQRSTENFLQLNVCAYYRAGNETNMAVMEVELPSGFTADVDAIQSIRSQAKGVKRVESTNDDTNVVIYFDRVTRDELCLTVPAHRNYKIANNKAVPVTLYDYYNRAQFARLFYEPLPSKTCDICEKEDCVNCNQITDQSGKTSKQNGDSGNSSSCL
ncbi:CD109 antigen-like protein, partial [Dinothrombium tinctorium]